LKPWRWVSGFFSSTRGGAAGFTAALGAAAATGLAAGLATGALAAVFAATLAAGAFEADDFDPAAFATVLAFLDGIALLFLEDFAAAAFLVSFTDALARPFDALRLAAALFLVFLEALCLRVFCDTACARETATPLFEGFYGNP
jgi:hypothetical protein